MSRGVDSYFWTAFFFPRNTPGAIIEKLHDATTAALERPMVVDGLRQAGVTPVAPAHRTPAYLTAFMRQEADDWAARVKASGVAIE